MLDRTWYNTLVDDDGSNLVGTVWNKAAVDALMDAVDVAVVDLVTTSTVTGNVHNWAVGLSGNALIRWNGAADAFLTGIAGGQVGQRITIRNYGTAIFQCYPQHAGSSAGNKLTNLITSGPTPVAPGGSITYIYSGTDWLLVAHEQGAWITPTYAAGTYTGMGAMTWTVDAGDVGAHAYRVTGKTLMWTVWLDTTTIGGTVDLELRVTLPGGYIASAGTMAKTAMSLISANTPSRTSVFAGGTYANVRKDDATTWSGTGANSVYIYFSLTVPLT